MTVNKKGKQPSFAGIVVTAGTRDEAVRNYADVARQKNVEVLASADNSFALATTAGSYKSFLNPLSQDKEKMKLVDSDLEITSSANEDNMVSVNYTMCSECDAHIIADDVESVSNCPECHSEVDFDRELEDDMESDSSIGEELEGSQGIVAVASSYEEAHAQYLEMLSGDSNVLEFQDQENNVSFVSNSSDINYSPYYGEEVYAEELESDSSAIEDAKERFGTQAHYFMCADSKECGMHVIASSEDITICPSCSTAVVDPEVIQELEEASMEMDEELDSISSEMDEDDDLLDDDLDLDLDDDEDEDDDLDDMDDEDDDLDDDIDLDDEDDDDLDDEDFEVVSSGEELESDSSDDDDMDDDEDEDDDDEEDEDEEDTEIDGIDDEEDEEDMESDSVAVNVSLDVMSAVANSSENGLQSDLISLSNVSVVDGENRWVAFHGSTPIAVASESSVEGNIKSIFTSNTYRQACLKAVANDGVREGLAQFGFKSISFDEETMQTVISKEIVSQADSKISQYENDMRQRDAKLLERMESALATSTMGINRGVFEGVNNPIIESLASSLRAAGVENPRQLVDNVFEANADAFNRLIVNKVSDLMSKSEDSQNEIAKMVSASSYARRGEPASTSTTFENRMNPRVVPQNQKAKTELESDSSGASFKSRMSSVLKNLK